VQHELHVAQGWGVVRHGSDSLRIEKIGQRRAPRLRAGTAAR
jgi:hypothetical protein